MILWACTKTRNNRNETTGTKPPEQPEQESEMTETTETKIEHDRNNVVEHDRNDSYLGLTNFKTTVISYFFNDIYNSTDKLKFSLFADDTNLLYADNDLRSLETTVNHELIKFYNWLTANKLSLN